MAWKDRLHELVNGESRDHATYLELADEAEKEGCCHEAGVLRDIAHEEKIHKRLLTEMLE